MAEESKPINLIADDTKLLKEAWGALNFILAFYEPGQRHLDTEAWKVAEASGRRVRAKLRETIDQREAAAKVLA